MRLAGLLVIVVAAAGCDERRDLAVEPHPIPPRSDEHGAVIARPIAGSGHVVLVTIDGARWEDVLEGRDPDATPGSELDPPIATPAWLMARTHDIVASHGIAFGAGGPTCGAVHPDGRSNISLPGYLELLTGRSTACTTNACDGPAGPTILDAIATRGALAASIASWEGLERAASDGSGDVLVSAGTRAWPEARPLPDVRLEALVAAGEEAPLPPAPSGSYRVDAITSSIALEYLRARRPTVLHVALGDADEWAHRSDRASYLEALREADRFIGDLDDALLALDSPSEPTTVIVTADHGRARNFRDHGRAFPESGRSFVIAFARGMKGVGVGCAGADIRLADVGATVRNMLGLPADGDPSAGHPIEAIASRR